MYSTKQQVLDSLDNLTNSKLTDSRRLKLIQPESFTRAKQVLLRKMNVNENEQLLVWKYEPTKSFYYSRGFAKAPLPQMPRSPEQHEKIISKFLIDYLNRKNILDRGEFRVRHSLSRPVAKDDRRIDPSYTFRVGKQFRRKVRSSSSNYKNQLPSRTFRDSSIEFPDPQKPFLI